ncbi:Crp/Fnr family transcriptional regulator [Sinirhodobacter populi]|uniref:Crp/Fnr family transcriptional regulator n=1 Tax=Paenirhodobacter populi TaxID=2306993 RepID=A0A443KNG4_9RHOB|nr:Crp/Fnr family transcriptional regulator [Sinirhodobacter populi]RWR34224.1 Crp/Fnr family transcriptional regulator [Sinirhodobacter populi]
MAASSDLIGDNLLLGRLVPEDRQRLARHLVARQMQPGDTLQKSGDDVQHTWFPCGAACGGFRVAAEDGGNPVEVACIGREGAIGGIVSNGRVPAYATAEVRAPGWFLMIRIEQLEDAKMESLALRHWLSRYSDCLVAQLLQNSACNARHTITQRCARWLLAESGRTGSPDIAMTQEQLAAILGVGRTFVTRVVGAMRAEGLIATQRGRIVLRDTEGLQKRCCDCSEVIAQHYDAVMSGIYGPVGKS